MEKNILDKEDRTTGKHVCAISRMLKCVFAIARTVSVVLLFVASIFFVTAVFSPVYIHSKLGIFSGLSADDFLILMSVCACIAVGLLVLEGIYIVRLIVKKSFSRYTEK